MTEHTLDDLLDATLNRKPLEFNQIFGELVLDRAREAVENKKIEIAKTMYNYNPPEDYDEPEEFEPEEYEEEEISDDEEA